MDVTDKTVMQRPNGEIWLISTIQDPAPSGQTVVTGHRWVKTRKSWTQKEASFVVWDLADWITVPSPNGQI